MSLPTITVTATDDFITINGQPARVWRGATAAGVPCVALVYAITTEHHAETRLEEFEALEHLPVTAQRGGNGPH